jgi:peptide chain release factor 2
LPPLGGYFDVDQSKIKLKELETAMNRPDFWSDQNQAKAVSQEYQGLKEEIENWENLQAEAVDLGELANLFQANGQMTETEETELIQKHGDLLARFEKLEFSFLFAGEYDKGPAIMSIHAGTGGVDAMDWASILLRMYLRFCERHGFATAIVDETPGAEAGIKSVTIEVTGRYAYGWLRSEAGVHRLVRISPFDAEKMRHTSFALVEVLPELPESAEFDLREEDLKIDVFRAGGHGGQSVNTTDSAVRITHIPTGITVKCQNERSQVQNRATAMKILKAKLLQFKQEQADADIEKIKGEHRRAQWGNQARSYVLQPYKLVKDHRTDHETPDTDRILNGELDDFVEAYLRQQAGVEKSAS